MILPFNVVIGIIYYVRLIFKITNIFYRSKMDPQNILTVVLDVVYDDFYKLATNKIVF